jgi:hypothetical protein
MNINKEKMKKAAVITVAAATIVVGAAIWMNKIHAEPKAMGAGTTLSEKSQTAQIQVDKKFVNKVKMIFKEETSFSLMKIVPQQDIELAALTLQRYENSPVEKEIECALRKIINNKKWKTEGIELLARDPVVECISSFKNPEATRIAAGLSEIAIYTGSADVMDAAAYCISKFRHRPSRAGNIAWDMGAVAFYTKDEYVVRRLAMILSHYGNTTALGESIANHIRGLAFEKRGKDDNKQIREILRVISMKTPGIPYGEWE